MNWKDFKKFVEECGVDDKDEIEFIDVNYPTVNSIDVKRNEGQIVISDLI